jgi:hypothetical protein
MRFVSLAKRAAIVGCAAVPAGLPLDAAGQTVGGRRERVPRRPVALVHASRRVLEEALLRVFGSNTLLLGRAAALD